MTCDINNTRQWQFNLKIFNIIIFYYTNLNKSMQFEINCQKRCNEVNTKW